MCANSVRGGPCISGARGRAADAGAAQGEAFNYNVSLLGPDTSAALSADPPPSAASLRSLRAQRRRDLERATREARQLLAQWHGDDRWRSQGGESEGSSDAALIESAQALREALPEAVDAAGVEEAASALAEAAGEAQESAHTYAAAGRTRGPYCHVFSSPPGPRGDAPTRPRSRPFPPIVPGLPQPLTISCSRGPT